MKTQSRSLPLSLKLTLAAFAFAIPLQAAAPRDFAQERIKSALNTMVQNVKKAETPADKREALNGFLTRADRVAALLQRAPFMEKSQRQAAASLQQKFAGYSAALQGTSEQAPLQDGELDAFASFMQQDIEQADGGIYLSTGAVIIVLIILILIL
jgi:hypothetical protein